MPSTSKLGQHLSDDPSQEEIALAVLDFQQRKGYKALLEQLTKYFQKLVQDIFKQYPHEITFPIDTKPMEHFLLGFEIEYSSLEELFENDLIPHLCNPFDPQGISQNPHYFEGFWLSDRRTKRVFVFVKNASNPKRQMFTKIHELFHFCQSLDPAFIDFLDQIINESNLKGKYVRSLIERSANLATAMYLIPEEHLKREYKKTTDIETLAKIYGVSRKTLEIRLEECKLTNNKSNDIFDVPF